MFYIIDERTDFKEVEDSKLDDSTLIIVEKTIMTKGRYKHIRVQLFNWISSYGYYPEKFIEFDKYSDDRTFYKEILEQCGKLIFPAGFVMSVSKETNIPIEVVTSYKTKHEKSVPLISLQTSLLGGHTEILDEIRYEGIESLYAQSSLLQNVDHNNYVPLGSVCHSIEAGKVLHSRMDQDKEEVVSDDNYKYITMKQVNVFPVITNCIHVPFINDSKVTFLPKHSIIISGIASGEDAFCRPMYVAEDIHNFCLSSKLYVITLKDTNPKYCYYIYKFFTDSNNVLSQLISKRTSMSINQFRCLWVPTLAWFEANMEYIPDYFVKLKHLSEKLSVLFEEANITQNQIQELL